MINYIIITSDLQDFLISYILAPVSFDQIPSK